MRRAVAVAAVLSLLWATVGHAQSLADRMPGDALIYFGWRGTADPGPGYDQSHLKAVLDQSQLPKVLHDSLPAMLDRLGEMNPQAGQIVQIITALGHPLVTHPTALYFGPVDLTNPNNPVYHLALLCDAGDDAASMADKAMSLVEMGGRDMPMQIFVKTFGNLVVISTFEWIEHPAKALADTDEFKTSFAGMSNQPTLAIYIDIEKGLSQIDTALIQAHAPPDVSSTWRKIRTALGLTQLKRIATADAFEGRDYTSQLFLESPGPRTGLAALIDERPLSDELLKRVPAGATFMSAGRFDLSRLMDQIRRGVTTVSPSVALSYDQTMQQVSAILGMDVQLDLIGAMGSEWAAYSDPNVAGVGPFGGVLINRPPDAAKLEASLTKFETTFTSMIGGLLRMSAPFITIEFRHEQIDGMNVHYAALPAITPAWVMSDGYWYIGLYPQVVVSAAKQAHEAAGKSILDNPAYQDFRKRVGGPAQIGGVVFMDTPKLAPAGYQNLLFLSRLFLGAGDVFGLHSPAMVVPELSKITPELEPEGSISWVDDAGLHTKEVSAFPGDAILAANGDMGVTLLQMFSSFAQTAAMQHGRF